MPDRQQVEYETYGKAKAEKAAAAANAAQARAAGSKINKGSLAAAAGEGEAKPDSDPEPKAKDYPGLAAYATARKAWMERRRASPQATAVANMVRRSQ